MKAKVLQRWNGPGGCAEVLALAAPLIISTSAHSIQMFVDRMFLMWYDREAMSAAMQAGMASFTTVCLFLGTVGYVNTFVAQYTGADRHRRVGPAIWQGIRLAIGAGIFMLCLIPLAERLFDLVGHDAAIRRYEVVYFKIMCLGGLPVLVSSAISGFFTGRGKTAVVMYVNIAGTGVNIILNYCLIFGRFGFPRWGIAGAAVATVGAAMFVATTFLWLFFRADHRRDFATWTGRRFDPDLLRRLIRYGLPNGVQFMLEMLAFTLFIVFVGRIDKISLAASTMAFQVNSLAFMPMIGFGIAVSTLVGQALGKNDVALAQRSTWSAFYMTMIYMALIAAGYRFCPVLFLYPFSTGADPEQFAAVEATARTLLGFVAFYCIFDTGNIIFSAVLKGAGDTRFVMVLTVVLSWTVMAIPAYLAVRFGWGLYAAWGFMTTYVCVLAGAFLVRFLTGKWKTMRVIEIAPPTVPTEVPAVPTVEVDMT